MELTTFWFILIAVLWAGYFVLEGFDFGVGMLLYAVGRDEGERRVALGSIGPLWDGNEVWLLVAGGATFAAFPEWYATLFSGFYLALFLLLVALIVRGIAIEYRNKVVEARWRQRCDRALVVSSAVPPLLLGVAFGNMVRGVPLNSDHEFTGNFFTLLNPYSLLAGVTVVALFAFHGAVFLALKTDGPVRSAAGALTRSIGAAAVLLAAAFLTITQWRYGSAGPNLTALTAAVALVAGFGASLRMREGLAFLGTALALVLVVTALFGDLWPRVMPSSTDAAFSLTVHNAASSPYTLKVMTWVAVIFTPVVLGYQGWTYWVFRSRLGLGDVGGVSLPPAQPRVPSERMGAETRR